MDLEDQGDHNPPWWTRSSFYILLMYLHARTCEKDLATPPSSPDVGTIGHLTLPGKLCPLTKEKSKEDPTCNTVYVAAIHPTGSCLQDI